MRTTIDIDEDLLVALRERARREKRSVGAVASSLIRESLTRVGPAEAVRNGFPQLLPRGGGVVTNELINSIRDEIGE